MRKTIIVFASLGFIACSSFSRKPADASAATASPAIDATLLAGVINDYAQLLNSRILSLDRDLITFHYEQGYSFNQAHKTDNFSSHKNWILGGAERFFDSSTGQDLQGPGLYVAIDPVASRSYGGSDPELSVIKIKKGTRLLDTSISWSDSELPILKRIVSAISCGDSPVTQTNDASVGMDQIIYWFRNSKNTQCVTVAMEVARKINLQAILYNYSAANLLNCREREQAINVIDASTVEVSSYFSKTLQEDPNSLGRFTNALYHEGSQDFQMLLNYDMDDLPVPIKDVEPSPSNTDYESWKSQVILNCGKTWASEYVAVSGSQDSFLKTQKLVYKFRDIQKLIIKDKRAFDKIAKNKVNFAVENISLIQMAGYRATKLAKDSSKFKQWQDAKKMMNNGDNSDATIAKIEQLLEEAGPGVLNGNFMSAYAKASVNLTPSSSDDPFDDIRTVLEKIGFGDRYIQIIIGDWAFSEGIPSPSLDPVDVKNILQKCSEIYSDPQQTLETIQSGICGMAP